MAEPAAAGLLGDVRILVALIGAGVSLAVALWSAWRSHMLERDKLEAAERLKRLEAELALAGKQADARRSYEWEARKRLFDEVEPILFLMGEVMEATLVRLANAAQAAGGGKLGRAPTSWLRGPDNYYLLTTVFRVLRPLACLRMMTEKLTRLDFSLDARVQSVYVLGKLYRDTLSGPFDLAQVEPFRPYAYVAPEAGKPYAVDDEPRQYMQHLYTDELEAIVDVLLVRDGEGHVSLKRYGEFRTELLDPGSETARRAAPALLLFQGMAPELRPVLWRALLACALIGKVMLDVLAERGPLPGVGRALGVRLLDESRAAWVAELQFSRYAGALPAELAACATALQGRLSGNRVAHIRLS